MHGDLKGVNIVAMGVLAKDFQEKGLQISFPVVLQSNHVFLRKKYWT